MSGIQRIAQTLNISQLEATDFYLQVKRRIERKGPSAFLVANCLEELPEPERTVNNVIALIKSKEPKSNTHLGYKPKKKKMGSQKLRSSDPRDHQRTFEKCPHGVPKFMLCAICDPEGFRKMTGID